MKSAISKKRPEPKGKIVNHKFDELTKRLTQSVTHRSALKQFGVGLAGMALACIGLANKVEASETKIAQQ